MNKPGSIALVLFFMLSASCNIIKTPTGISPVQTTAPTSEYTEEVIENGFYVVQDGTPVFIPNFVRPDYGCNWTGIAGQVFDIEGVPQVNLVIEIQGTLDGAPVLFLALTGGSPEIGPAGYLLTFADYLIASEGTLTIQILDLYGNPLSNRNYINTIANCEQNLVIFNFVEVHKSLNKYLPLILNY